MSDSRSAQPALEAPLPEHLVMMREAGGLTLVYAWFRPMYVFLLFFCIFWDGFLVFWYRTALAHPSPGSIALWFPLIHVGVGVGITYSTIAGFLNRTRVSVDAGEVTIRHGPVPWIGNRKIPAAALPGGDHLDRPQR